MKRLTAILLLCTATLVCAQAAEGWLDKIRPGHPRLFINEEILPLIKTNATGPIASHYADVKATASRVLDHPDIQFHVYECTLPGLMICYYVDGEQKYKDKALWILKKGSKHLGEMFKKKKAVSWFSFARISLMIGYDWLYHDLSPKERKEIAADIIENVRVINDKKHPKISGENYYGFPGGGFYGVRNLKWYAGLTFHGEGVDDELCVQWMKDGLADFEKVRAFRSQSGGDDGGMSAVVLGYVFGAYPRCEWNLIHTWRSAIGDNIADRYSYLANITNWIAWRTINGTDKQGNPQLYGYGTGDTHHGSNTTGYSNNHLAQIQYFYGASMPEQSQLAAYIRSLNKSQKLGGYHFEELYAFLLDWSKMSGSDVQPYQPDEHWAHARHFEFLGQFFMRSGFGPDDTYCLFNAGHKGAGHGHFDEGNFIIYKKGFLALDTGTRDQTGGRKREADSTKHNTEYYNRTIAHNCLLIKMPGEKMPHHWGNVPRHNDGGQNKAKGSKIRAFSTNEHYTYVNADLTPVYSDKKVSLVNRQFIYIHPNHFVIVDRVKSTKAEYPKTFLLHSQNEPTVTDKTLRAEHRGGVMFCKTLYPLDAQQELIGGPGKTAWVDGKNFPVTQKYIDSARKKFKGKAEGFELLTGNWRLEVTPGSARTDDIFVHVIEVGDKGALTAMHDATLKETDSALQIMLNLDAAASAHIHVAKDKPLDGRIHIKTQSADLAEALATTIQKQDTVSGN